MTQHLGMAAHAHAATSEFILEATIDTLDGRAFVVTSLLRQDQPTGTPCLRLLPQRLLARAAAGVDVDDRNMTQGAAVGADFDASQALSIRSYRLRTRPTVRVASGMATWLSCSDAEVSRQLTGMAPSAASICNLQPLAAP